MSDHQEKSLTDSLGTILGYLAVLFIGPAIFQICWNYLMVGVFHLPLLNYWQSFAAVVLLGFLRGRK